MAWVFLVCYYCFFFFSFKNSWYSSLVFPMFVIAFTVAILDKKSVESVMILSILVSLL